MLSDPKSVFVLAKKFRNQNITDIEQKAIKLMVTTSLLGMPSVDNSSVCESR